MKYEEKNLTSSLAGRFAFLPFFLAWKALFWEILQEIYPFFMIFGVFRWFPPISFWVFPISPWVDALFFQNKIDPPPPEFGKYIPLQHWDIISNTRILWPGLKKSLFKLYNREDVWYKEKNVIKWKSSSLRIQSSTDETLDILSPKFHIICPYFLWFFLNSYRFFFFLQLSPKSMFGSLKLVEGN